MINLFNQNITKNLYRHYSKVENVSVVPLVVSVLTGVMPEELMIVEEEEAVRQEEGVHLAPGMFISLPQVLIRDRITIIIVI